MADVKNAGIIQAAFVPVHRLITMHAIHGVCVAVGACRCTSYVLELSEIFALTKKAFVTKNVTDSLPEPL